jgi:hypothetical protein
VAYAEKRGKGPEPWRVKYKLPSGMEVSESGFKTKAAAALTWGRDQEARIREGRWADPDAGNITVSEWIERWLAMQDVGVSTVENREYLIRRFLRPAWGASEPHSLSTEEITKWENSIPARTGVSRRVARDARSLLCTILGDAAAAKPPLIPYNPALRPRNRGRRTGRRLERAPKRVWATPLQALLVAERAALLTGRDGDFTMVLTIGYTGLRYGETIGLERGYVRQDEIHVEWQLREIRSTFHRIPPKDDSYRSPSWEPCLPVDLPPFLAELLARQSEARSRRRCACATQHGGSGQYVFLGPDGGHYRRSGYARRVFRPACDGRKERSTRPPRPTDRHGRHHLAGPPGRHLATSPARRRLRAAPRPGHTGHSRGHPACLLAAAEARPDAARLEARPQNMDGRRWHRRDPRRAAPGPRGARHARPLRPRLRPDARRSEGRPPGPLGGLPARPRRHPLTLTRPATRRVAGQVPAANPAASRPDDTTNDTRGANGTGRQGEDDLPNSSQNGGRPHPRN